MNRQLAAFEFDAVEFFQNGFDVFVGHVHERHFWQEMDCADAWFWNARRAENHSNDVAGTNGVIASDIHREASHAGFVRDRIGALALLKGRTLAAFAWSFR